MDISAPDKHFTLVSGAKLWPIESQLIISVFVSLRYKQNTNITPLLLFSSTGTFSPYVILGVFTVLGLTLIWALVIAASYYVIYQWTFRLEFDSVGVHTKSRLLPRKYHFRCTYASIQQIAADKLSPTIIFIRNAGKPKRLSVYGLDPNPQAILEEFAKHLPNNSISADASRQIAENSAVQSRVLVVFSVCFSLIYIAMLILPIQNLFTQNTAWTAVNSLNLGKEYTIEAFSVESNTDFIVVAGKDFPRNYAVVASKNGQTQTWQIGTQAQLPQPFPFDRIGGFSPSLVVLDALGHPWVASDFDGLLHWTGNNWEWYTFPHGSQSHSVTEMVISGDKILVSAPNYNVPYGYYLQIDPATSSAERVALPIDPEVATLSPSHVNPTRNGFIVTFTNNKGAGYFYLLHDGRWERLAKIPERYRPSLDSDMTLDLSGNLWVLTYEFSANASTRIWVGQYLPSTQSWNWFSIPDGSYSSLVVDSKNRLWIKAKDYLDVFLPSQTSMSQLLTHYDANNSYFQNNFARDALQLGPDGKLWVADKTLVWMDTHLATVPSPLPDWFVKIVSYEATVYIWFPIETLAFIAIFIMQFFQIRRNRSIKKEFPQ